jgi:hypothetical protein
VRADVTTWLSRGAVALVCALPFYGLWIAAGPPMEEGFMLVFPELVLEGELPNRDFLHLYGPGGLWVLAALFWVFGTSMATERAVGFLQHLGIVTGVYAVLRPWGPAVAAGGGVAAAIIIIPPAGLTALAWVGGMALGLWAVRSGVEALDADAGSRRRRRQLVIAGLLAGAALLYRADLIVALALSLAVIVPALRSEDRRRLFIALAIGVSPYLVHIATAGLGDVVDGMFIEPVFDLRGGRSLPLPPSTDDFDGFLQRAGDLPFIRPPYPLPAPPGPWQLTLWLGLILVVNATLVIAGIRCLRRRGDRRLLAVALYSAGLLTQGLQRADSTHLAWVSCIAFGILPAAIIELLPERQRARTLTAIALPFVLMLFAFPHFTYRSYGDAVAQTLGWRRVAHTMEYGDRHFYYARTDAVAAVNAMLPVVDRVSDPGDRLFVGPGDLRKTPYSEAFLYFLLPELVPATRYIEMDPGVANAEDSGLADELRAADVVILSSIRDDWNEPNDSLDDGPNEPNEVLASEFCLVESFGEGLFGRGLYELYVKCP